MAAKKLGRLVLALLVSAITAVVVVGSGGSIAWANAVGTSGSGAGTNIGDASVLTGTTNGSLTGTQAEDWYVVYPATIGGIVQLQITDTAPSTVCQGLFYSIYNTDGTGGTLASSPLGPGSPFEGPVSSAGSDRYYVEITPYGCSPTASKPLTYSVTVVSGGGGPVPDPTPATVSEGVSLSTAGSPLRGHMLYSEAGVTSDGEAWFQLAKSGKAPATIRLQDTTIDGSNGCGQIIARMYDGNGSTDGWIASAILSNNGAETLPPVTKAGQYYVEFYGDGCNPNTATTFTIEPEPTTAWNGTVAHPPVGKIKAGTSMGTVGAPLHGGTLYRGTPGTSSGQAWYQLIADASNATVRVEDTTVDGSNGCGQLIAQLDNPSGGAVSKAILGNNGAASLPTSGTGQYYLVFYGDGCTPNSATTFSIEPKPTSAWTIAPNRAAPHWKVTGSAATR